MPFSFIFKHPWAPKRSSNIFHGGPESLGKVLDFFIGKRVGTLVRLGVTDGRTIKTRNAAYQCVRTIAGSGVILVIHVVLIS